MDVLVVDDDPAFARIVSHALRKDGHEVVAAANAQEALSQLQLSLPRLVLLDLMIPGINGLQLLLALKSDSNTSGIPVVVWTATFQEDLARQAFAFGADAMLVKLRFSMPELRRLVGRLIKSDKIGHDAPRMKRVLVVEDDDNTREAVVKHLSGAGYSVSEAENGWEALLALDREEFALVVLDLVMPEMDGQTFLRIVRNSKHKDIPVIVLTAYDLAEMGRIVEPLGVSQVMGKKPPLWDDLLPAVRAVLMAA